MYIGAHISTAGGLGNAIKNGLKIGVEAIQLFPSAPMRWQIRGWSDEECEQFKNEWPKHFKDAVFHGIYLTNLASESKENLDKTKTALINTLRLSSKLGIVGTVFHPGTYVKGKIGREKQIKAAIQEILAETPVETKLIFENSAGSVIGGRLEDLAWLIEAAVSRNRVGVCLDTCHAFAAGYDIRSQEGYENYIGEVERLNRSRNIFCWHLNESKFVFGSKRDRHANIGEGFIGQPTFGFILNDVRWQNKVGYLEVPGFDDNGPDEKNINILKIMRR